MMYLAEFKLYNFVDGKRHRCLNIHSEGDTFRRVVKITNPNPTYHKAIISELLAAEYPHLEIGSLCISKMLSDEGTPHADV